MNFQKGFANMLVILAMVGLLVVGGGIVAFNYFLSNSSTNLNSSAYSPTPLDIKTPKSDSETGFKAPEEKKSTPSAKTPTPVPSPLPTQTVTQLAGVSVTTVLSSDKKTFTINFLSSNNFAKITSISYSLTYTADSGAQGVQGTININGDISPITKTITLGTCSTGGTCVYDANPRYFHLSVSTK